jgi:hypothetical protein
MPHRTWISLIGWFIDRLISWLTSCLIDWLVDRLIDRFIGCLTGVSEANGWGGEVDGSSGCLTNCLWFSGKGSLNDCSTNSLSDDSAKGSSDDLARGSSDGLTGGSTKDSSVV